MNKMEGMKLGKVCIPLYFENLNEYGCQALDPATKVHHLLNGISCDNMSTAIATVDANIDRYEKDFGAFVSYLLQ